MRCTCICARSPPCATLRRRMPSRFPFVPAALLAGWNLMFFKAARYEPDRTRSAEWNRGAYLTLGLGHCGACHTPRNVLGAEREALALTGSAYLDEVVGRGDRGPDHPDWRIPRCERGRRPTSPRQQTALGAWSIEDTVAYLKTGHNARAGAFGPMSGVVLNSTRYLTGRGCAGHRGLPQEPHTRRAARQRPGPPLPRWLPGRSSITPGVGTATWQAGVVSPVAATQPRRQDRPATGWQRGPAVIRIRQP